MQFDIPMEQFQDLLRLIYLGMWVAESRSQEEESDPLFDRLSSLEQRFFQMAHDNGLADWVMKDPDNHSYFAASALDEDKEIAEAIDIYEENCFWDELIDRLAIRDMINRFGVEKIAGMSHQERYEKEKELVNFYENEFHDFGLKRLSVHSAPDKNTPEPA